MAEHVVKMSDLDYQTPPEFVGRSSGYIANNVVADTLTADKHD